MSDMPQPKQEVSLAELLDAMKTILSNPIIIFVNGDVAVINADQIYEPFPEKPKDLPHIEN